MSHIEGDSVKTWLVIVIVTFIAFSSTCLFADAPAAPDVVFVSIPGGTFQMGDEMGDLWKSCRPVHTVTVSPFRMSESEITNAQYCVFLNDTLARKEISVTKSAVKGRRGLFSGKFYIHLSDNFTSFPGNQCRISYSRKGGFEVEPGYENWPVVCVTWFGAKAFAECYGWDLPREAEWEYACRGGKQARYGTCDDTVSDGTLNYEGPEGVVHPVDVKSYPPNAFGLYDMSGNVWEWCLDWYGGYPDRSVENPVGAKDGIWRIMRGGGWSDPDEQFCRASTRYFSAPRIRSTALGFRVVVR